MTPLPEQLKEMADEFRIYACSETNEREKERWIDWAATCEAAAEALQPTLTQNDIQTPIY